MITAFRAEWIRLSRPKMFATVGLLFGAFGVLGAALTFSTAAKSQAQLAGHEKFETTLANLAHPAGASHGFIVSTSLIGIVVAVLAAATVGADYSLGTWRPVLVRHPQRSSLLAGKTVAIMTLVAGALAVTWLVALVVSYIGAASRGVSTGAWISMAGATAAGNAYLKALFICVASQLIGTAVAVLTRSTTIAVVAVVVWAVPVERIVGSSITSAPHWLPGLLLEALSVSDTATATTAHVVLVVSLITVALSALAIADFVRRDVTA
jgi:ABC-type transport system involved in multi-copper enzyme maturation permease subunit